MTDRTDSEPANNYAVDELMLSRMAAQVNDGDLIHNGAFTPLGLSSAMLAKMTHAPDVTFYPISVAAVRTEHSFPITLSLLETMALTEGLEQRADEIWTSVEGRGVEIEYLSPPQMDMYGNMNATVIGDIDDPDVRLPGVGGLDMLSIMRSNGHPERNNLKAYVPNHSPRVFVEEVDFRTGPGYLDGGDARSEAGLPADGGPKTVITDLAILGFDEETKRMQIESVHPHSSISEVQDETGFELLVPDKVPETVPPTQEEVAIIRNDLDPFGLRKLEFLSAEDRIEQVEEILEAEEEYFLGHPST